MTLSDFQTDPRGRTKRRGIAAVELAFFLPLLLFCSMAVVDFSRLVYAQVTLQNCARNGAIYEFYKAAGYSMPSNWTSLSNAMTADEGGVTVAGTATSPASPTNNYVTVTATTTFYPLTLSALKTYPAISGSIALSQTATMPYPASTNAVP
jgi:uncharacterized membrane protein